MPTSWTADDLMGCIKEERTGFFDLEDLRDYFSAVKEAFAHGLAEKGWEVMDGFADADQIIKALCQLRGIPWDEVRPIVEGQKPFFEWPYHNMEGLTKFHKPQ